MGIRAHLPKTLTIAIDAPQSAAATNTIPGSDAATALKTFLNLSLQTYGGVNYLANYFASAQAGDELFEAASGLLLSTRVDLRATGARQIVCLSGQTLQRYVTSAPVQFGHQLEVAANGTVSPANADTDRLGGLAMFDAGTGETVYAVTQGLWFGQVNPGALPGRNVDCTTDASGRVIAGASGDVVDAILMSTLDFTILTRPCRLFFVSRPILLA